MAWMFLWPSSSRGWEAQHRSKSASPIGAKQRSRPSCSHCGAPVAFISPNLAKLLCKNYEILQFYFARFGVGVPFNASVQEKILSTRSKRFPIGECFFAE